jgi:DnaJ-class molecular chaperone
MDPNNMKEIFKMAQEVAKTINIPKDENGQTDASQVDMSKIFQEVSKSVGKMVTPEFVEKFSQGETKITNKNPKSRIVMDSDDEVELTENSLPKTKDLHFTLNVSLKHFYTGKTKNIAVKRQRYKSVDGRTELQEDRVVLNVNIKPGMQDEEIIIFEGEGDEKKGYIPGDVIITLCAEEHPSFTRINNDLFMTQNISLSECYDLDFTFKHIDGKLVGVKRSGHNIMKANNIFKMENMGMPIIDEERYGNLYIKFECDVADSLSTENVELLKTIMPPVSTRDETENYHSIIEVTEEELDSFYYNPDEDEDEDEDDDEEI